jgi:uracil phosphoribosyltransferase
MRDSAYMSYRYAAPELPHSYGPHVHLLADPVLLTQLAQLSRPETLQPDITYLVRDLYQALVRTVLACELPRMEGHVRTRMFTATPNGVWSGSMLDPDTKVVTVDIARAGTLPSQVAFETLTRLLSPDAVRQDHIYMNRVVDGAGAVVGVNVAGSKIGGPANDAIVFLPDPMGATGGSMARCVSMYKELEGGSPRKIVALNLIVTPEYLAMLKRAHPDVIVYALRCDRGMSAPEILKTGLGENWQQERGLNERQYIVPGAGGLGEVLNNSYV